MILLLIFLLLYGCECSEEHKLYTSYVLDSLPSIALDDHSPLDQTVEENGLKTVSIDCLENQNKNGFAHRTYIEDRTYRIYMKRLDPGVDLGSDPKISWVNRQLFHVQWSIFTEYFKSRGRLLTDADDKCFIRHTEGAKNGILEVILDPINCPRNNRKELIFTCHLEYVGHRMQSIADIRANQFGSRKKKPTG